MTRPYPADAEAAFSPFATRNTVIEGVQAKKQVIHDLIEGHLTLLEAAARFSDIHCHSTANLEQSLGIFPTQDGESICRTVIGWVPLLLNDRPEQADAIVERLEGELTEMLATTGKVSLPEVE